MQEHSRSEDGTVSDRPTSTVSPHAHRLDDGSWIACCHRSTRTHLTDCLTDFPRLALFHRSGRGRGSSSKERQWQWRAPAGIHRLSISGVSIISSITITTPAASASHATRSTMGKRKAKIGGYGKPGKLDIVFDEPARRCGRAGGRALLYGLVDRSVD